MSQLPHRVQLSRKKGWRLPANTVSVARPTKYGNQWEIWRDPEDGEWKVTDRTGFFKVENEAEGRMLAVKKHKEDLERLLIGYSFGARADILELRGKNLAYWCALDQPCHADVLLGLANR